MANRIGRPTKYPTKTVLKKSIQIANRIRGDQPLSTSQRRDLYLMLSRLPESKHTEKNIEIIIGGLPHLFGYPWYKWARDFFDSTNKNNLITAANQISKSSTQIRKTIHWATCPSLWPKLWKRSPRQFLYLYPDKETATSEFDTKWVPEFLPRGAFKEHPVFGWESVYRAKYIHSVIFKAGPILYFKSYMQRPDVLQARSVDAIFTDEELPVHFYDELAMRLSATEGYFHCVFTATLNQPFWKAVMEGKGDKELLPSAFKQQISMYDCLEYEDGTPGGFTKEKIKRIEESCRSATEVLRRVHGKFVTEEGRTYPTFEYMRHMVDPKKYPIGEGGGIFVGVDVGSGGANSHPAAILFVWVNSTYTKGLVFLGWRGDGVQTTSHDIVEKYKDLERYSGRRVTRRWYDWAAKDFYMIALQSGIAFEKADKARERGEDVLNTLFQNDMLLIHDTEELQKLGLELTNLMKGTAKAGAADDFCDALRYACSQIPWDFSTLLKGDSGEEIPDQHEKVVETRSLTQEEYMRWVDEERYARTKEEKKQFEAGGGDTEGWREFDEECEFWSEQCEV